MITREETNVEFRLVNDDEMPPIVITMNEKDDPKVVLNSEHKIWLSLHRKTIGGCAEALFEKIDELLTAHLKEQRSYEQLDRTGDFE